MALSSYDDCTRRNAQQGPPTRVWTGELHLPAHPVFRRRSCICDVHRARGLCVFTKRKTKGDSKCTLQTWCCTESQKDEEIHCIRNGQGPRRLIGQLGTFLRELTRNNMRQTSGPHHVSDSKCIMKRCFRKHGEAMCSMNDREDDACLAHCSDSDGLNNAIRALPLSRHGSPATSPTAKQNATHSCDVRPAF